MSKFRHITNLFQKLIQLHIINRDIVMHEDIAQANHILDFFGKFRWEKCVLFQKFLRIHDSFEGYRG